jgi:hypothetical protein
LVAARHYGRDVRLDFLPHRGNLCGQEAAVPHLSPTTLTTDEQRLILRATAAERNGFLAASVQERP